VVSGSGADRGMNILFLTHPYPNYVPDLLLHGLRKLLGPAVVEYPRKNCLYRGVLGLGICPPNQLCPGWFPQDDGPIDRSDIPAKIEKGFFGLIVSDVRAIGQWMPFLERSPSPFAIIDGEDRPVPIRPGRYVVFRRETDGTDYSIPLPMALPEEIFNWIVSYDGQPKTYSIGFLGSTQDDQRRRFIEQLAACYPDGLFSASVVPSQQNPFPEGRYGRDDYYRELQKCRIVISLAGAGYDTFRFWENAACNAIHAAQELPLYIPSDFRPNDTILRFSSFEQLQRMADRALECALPSNELIANGRLHLVQHHFTTSRARYFLNCLRKAHCN
jgi:hypothetical protein